MATIIEAEKAARAKPHSRRYNCCRLVLVAATTSSFVAFPKAAGADWPEWRGPKRDGISTESGWNSQWPKDGPKQLWKASLGPGCASFAVVGDRVFTVGNKSDNDIVYCLDAATGAEIWKHSYPAPLDPNMFEGGPAGTPTVNGELLYTVSRAGLMLCLRADSGKVVWSKDFRKDFKAKPPQWGYSSSPLVVGNLVVVDVGSKGASTVAFEKATGKLVWRSGNEGVSYSSPVLFTHRGRECVAVFNPFGFVARELATGKDVLRHPWKTSYDVNAATPIMADGKVFIASGYSKGAALLDLTGSEPKVVWQSKSMRNKINSSVLWNGALYGFDESNLNCLDFATGKVRWEQRNLGMGSLMIADGKLIILSEDGKLVIAEAAPDAFKEIARAEILKDRCWVVPVLANGRLYGKNNNGNTVCLDLSGR